MPRARIAGTHFPGPISERTPPDPSGSPPRRKSPIEGNRPHERPPRVVKPPRPAKVESAAFYELAWEAYRQRGKVADAIGALAPHGVDQGTVRGFVHVGVPAMGLRPLSVMLEESARASMRTEATMRGEMERLSVDEAAMLVESRVKAVAEAKARSESILGDATTQHEAEAKLARGNRMLTEAMLSAMGSVMMGMPALVGRVRKAMESTELSLEEGLDAIRTIGTTVHKISEATRTAIQAEHLVLGKPTSIKGTQHEGPEMSPEEAEQYIAIVTRAAKRHARNRTPVVVEPELSDRSDTITSP